MSRKDTFLNITGQIICGSIIGFITSLACYLLTYELFVKILVGNRIEHGFLVGLLTFISLAITYGCGIASMTEGIRLIGNAANELQERGGGRAIASMCVGGGQGTAILIEGMQDEDNK